MKIEKHEIYGDCLEAIGVPNKGIAEIDRDAQADPIEAVADYLIDNGVTIQKHGRWIMRGGRRYCSECGQRACVTRDSEDFWYTVGTDYCPNCGAKMDLEAEFEKN